MQDEWKANVKAIVSLIVSIVSILCCCVWYVGLILGVVALVLGILGYRDQNPNQKDAAIAGIVVSSAGIALAVSVAIMTILVMQQTPVEPEIQEATGTTIFIVNKIKMFM